MALPNDYSGQTCSLARTLEIVGERWTLLILRDAFFGVRRFGDFVARLDIPRAVLTERLKSLTSAGILVRVPGAQGRDEYQLTDKGVSLWPTVRTLMAWGDAHYAPSGPRRAFLHAADDGAIDPTGRCTRCDATVEARDTIVVPGPGLPFPTDHDNPVTVALRRPHRLLEPLRVAAVPAREALHAGGERPRR
jgi:DNA-binding HxlR family transcriptional regulator